MESGFASTQMMRGAGAEENRAEVEEDDDGDPEAVDDAVEREACAA